MAPERDFYINPPKDAIEAAERWRKVNYMYTTFYGREKKKSFHSAYPCKITTAKGQELLAVIGLYPYNVEAGFIQVPFGVWNKGDEDPFNRLMIEKAKAMGGLDLIGGVESDSDRYKILGIDKNKLRNFDVTHLRGDLQVIKFNRRIKWFSKAERIEDEKWPVREVRVEGLVRDFGEDFPGWKIEPVALER